MLSNDTFQLDRRIIHQAETLAKNNFEVFIIIFKSGLPLPNNISEGVYIIESDDYIDFKPSLIHRLKGWLAGFRLVVQFYQFISSFSQLNFLKLSNSQLNQIPKEVDYVVAHDLPTLPEAYALKYKLKAKQLIFDAHEFYEGQLDTIFSKRLVNAWSQVSKKYIPKVDRCISVTQSIADEINHVANCDKDFLILPNAHPYIPESEFGLSKSIHEIYKLDVSRKIILCCGGVTRGRHLEDFIYAAQYMDESYAVCFLGFADSEYLKELKSVIRRLGLESMVFIGQSVAPDEVVTVCNSADLGVISNRGDGSNNLDGCPNRLYEYIQARVPIFSYRHKGVSDLVKKTSTGYVCDWKHPKDLANKLQSASLKKYSSSDLEQAAKVNSWEFYEESYLALYSK